MSSSSDNVHHSGSTSMFGIFVLSIYSLVIIPYTISHFCSESEGAVQPWNEKVTRTCGGSHGDTSLTQIDSQSKKKKSLADSIKKHCTKGEIACDAVWSAAD